MKKLLPDLPKTFKGIMLLASPALSSSIFSKSCILIYKASQKGHEGFIINQPLDKTVGDIMPKTKGKALADLPLHLGGPVEPESINFMVLSQLEEKLHYKPFVSIEEAEYSFGDPDTVVLACVGHSSWTKGQLESECDQHTWFYDQPDSSIIQNYEPKKLWLRRLATLSPYHRMISMSDGQPLQN